MGNQHALLQHNMEGIEYSSAADGACYLLRIPKEIRLNIYRYLILPTPTSMISITPGDAFEDDFSDDEEVDVDVDLDDPSEPIYRRRLRGIQEAPGYSANQQAD